MLFLPGEMRRRHDFMERSIAESRTALATPLVAQTLGHYAAILQDVSSRLFVPDIRHGRMVVPQHQVSSDGVAMVALRRGERLGVPPEYLTFSSRQRPVAQRLMGAWGPFNVSDEAMTQRIEAALAGTSDLVASPGERYARLEGGGLANIASRTVEAKFRETGSFTAHPRPLLTVKYRPLGRAYHDPAIMAHEYTHVWQFEREPVTATQTNEMWLQRLELEAYHVGTLVIEGLRDSGHRIRDVARQAVVERIRSEVNGDQGDPFASSPALLARLANEGLNL